LIVDEELYYHVHVVTIYIENKIVVIAVPLSFTT